MGSGTLKVAPPIVNCFLISCSLLSYTAPVRYPLQILQRGFPILKLLRYADSVEGDFVIRARKIDIDICTRPTRRVQRDESLHENLRGERGRFFHLFIRLNERHVVRDNLHVTASRCNVILRWRNLKRPVLIGVQIRFNRIFGLGEIGVLRFNLRLEVVANDNRLVTWGSR